MMKQTKHYRRILAAIVAAVLTVGMSLTAFATGEIPQTSTPDTKGSITITNPKEDTTYYGYKIFDVTYAAAGDETSYSYTIAGDSDWFSIVDDYAKKTPSKGLTLIKAAGANEYVVTITDGVFSAADFASHLKANVGSITEDFKLGPKGESEPELKKSDLALGYYFVKSEVKDEEGNITTQALCNLTTTDPDATIKDKNDTSFKKEISEIDETAVTGTDPVTNKDVQVGAVLTYKIKGAIPDRSGAETYYYHASDTMSKGLTFDATSVEVKIGSKIVTLSTVTSFDKNTTGNVIMYNAAVTSGDKQNGGGFELSLDLMEKEADGTLKYSDNDEIVITYKATVNKDAVNVISENEAELKYGTDPDNLAESKPQIVRTLSSQIDADKYRQVADASDMSNKLAGAKFVLKRKTGADAEYYKGTFTGDAGNTDPANLTKVEWVKSADVDGKSVVPDLDTITVVTTDASGAATFAGLENGLYELIEVEAPAGYNLLKDPVEVVVNAVIDPDSATGELMTGTDYTTTKISVPVANSDGSFLPSTGGIGTTIFYVLGSVLLLVAVVWFVVSRRKAQTGEK